MRLDWLDLGLKTPPVYSGNERGRIDLRTLMEALAYKAPNLRAFGDLRTFSDALMKLGGYAGAPFSSIIF